MRNLSKTIELANQSPVAVLNHKKPAAYLISAPPYEDMLEQLKDAAPTKTVKRNKSLGA
nr:hypothetical protein [uncultured Limnohabitans sp.]